MAEILNKFESDTEGTIYEVNDFMFPQQILKKAIKNKLFSDVTLVTEDNLVGIPAHRVVLSAASEYFSTMFTTDMIEKHQNKIKIKQVTGESLKLLVNYCYTGELRINSGNVVDLLAAASLMGFERIKQECEIFFKKELKSNSKSSFEIFSLAQMYSFTELAKKSFEIICGTFNELSKTSEFYEIHFEYLERILDSEEKFDGTEQDIFEAAMRWVDFNRSEREKFIPNILKLIRLTQIDPKYLCQKVQPLCVSNNCLELLIAVFNWHFLPEPEKSQLFTDKQLTKRSSPLKLFVIGKSIVPHDMVIIESYCNRSKKWTPREKVKFPKYLICPYFAAIKETVYVVDNENMFSLDLNTFKITSLASLPIQTRIDNVAVMNKSLYVFSGGYNFKRYDTEQNEWINCKSLTTPRSGLAVAVLDNYLYAIGGFTIGGGVYFLKSVERYSPVSDTWTSVKSMNIARANSGAGILNGKIYVVGGENDNLLSHVEYYDPNTDIWTQIASLTEPGFGLAVAFYDNELFAISGSRTAEGYNRQENKWEKIESLNCETCHPIAIVTRGFSNK